MYDTYYTLHTAGILRHALGTAKRPCPHKLRPVNARCMRLPTFSLKGNTYLYRAPNLYHNSALPACYLLQLISCYRISHILFAILAHPKPLHHPSTIVIYSQPPAAAFAGFSVPNPASGTVPRPFLLFTTFKLQTPPNTAHLQPHPANAIHHDRHTPLYPRPYRHSAQTTQHRNTQNAP